MFLLPSGLEVDVAVTPAEEFGARGPHFRALFGTTHKLEATPQPGASSLIGLGWHHVLHARSCIDRLPAAVTEPLTDALVRSLDGPELRRAPAVVTRCLIGELEEWDPLLCARLKPLLQEFG